jgi:hypothetical protein
MGREWEQHDEVEVGATPQQVWEAIATGLGYDSWFMGGVTRSCRARAARSAPTWAVT